VAAVAVEVVATAWETDVAAAAEVRAWVTEAVAAVGVGVERDAAERAWANRSSQLATFATMPGVAMAASFAVPVAMLRAAAVLRSPETPQKATDETVAVTVAAVLVAQTMARARARATATARATARARAMATARAMA